MPVRVAPAGPSKLAATAVLSGFPRTGGGERHADHKLEGKLISPPHLRRTRPAVVYAALCKKARSGSRTQTLRREFLRDRGGKFSSKEIALWRISPRKTSH